MVKTTFKPPFYFLHLLFRPRLLKTKIPALLKTWRRFAAALFDLKALDSNVEEEV